MRRALLALPLWVAACSPSSPPSSSSASASSPAAVSAPAPALVVREGELEVSKGNPAVADVLLAHGPVVERFGREWRKTAVGTRIRVTGMLRIIVCDDEHVQCLSTGQIPILTPDLIEVLGPPPASSVAPAPPASSGASAPPASSGVSAPPALSAASAAPAPRETSAADCQAACQRQSDECDRGARQDRGQLRRCGSRLIGCRTRCDGGLDR